MPKLLEAIDNWLFNPVEPTDKRTTGWLNGELGKEFPNKSDDPFKEEEPSDEIEQQSVP